MSFKSSLKHVLRHGWLRAMFSLSRPCAHRYTQVLPRKNTVIPAWIAGIQSIWM